MITRWLAVFVTLIMLVSCNTQKYLSEDDQLLDKTKIVILSDQRNSEKNALKYELRAQLRQLPNDKAFIFFKPRLWFYYRQEEKKDSTDFDKFIQRRLAEPPSMYDENQTQETVESMTELLFRKGYLNAKVWYTDTLESKMVYVTYFAQPNHLYTVRSFELVYPNDTIEGIIAPTLPQSFLKPGAPVSNALLGLEKQRITDLLQNSGYASFTFRNFSVLEATDSTGGTVDLRLRILTGQEGRLTPKSISSITVRNRFEGRRTSTDTVTTRDSIRFVGFNQRNRVKPNALLKYIKLRPGDLYQREALYQTRNQLQLPAIRFADIQTIQRDSHLIDLNIDLVPAKRIETEYEFEVSQTQVSSQSFLGIGGSVNLINNNFLGGSERLSNAIDVSFEIDPDQGGIFNAANVNFNNSLEFPRFADPFNFYKLLNKWNILKNEDFDNLRNNASSILNIGYEYVELFRFFNYNSFTAEYGFRAVNSQLGRRTRIQITHPSFTYFDPNLKDDFLELYDENTFAFRSFSPQLFTSFFFNRLVYSIEKLQGARGISSAFISTFELSGVEIYLINEIANRLSKPFRIGDLTFAQFGKLDLDGRLYRQINPEQSLAFRANVGVALPFGSSELVPYVKQFYLGGPISIRAWKIRELGPGAHVDTTVTREKNLPFFQTGDIKLLLNAEYRFDILWRLEGAIFLDAGNIWTLKKDDREGGVFTSQFLRQIAIGSGAGFRFDADYFKVVIDLGLKLRNPFPDEEGSYRALKAGVPGRELLNLNFAINYPF